MDATASAMSRQAFHPFNSMARAVRIADQLSGFPSIGARSTTWTYGMMATNIKANAFSLKSNTGCALRY